MLKAIGANEELLARYRTVGELVDKDPKFKDRKRNKGGDYAHTMAREAIESEVATTPLPVFGVHQYSSRALSPVSHQYSSPMFNPPLFARPPAPRSPACPH